MYSNIIQTNRRKQCFNITINTTKVALHSFISSFNIYNESIENYRTCLPTKISVETHNRWYIRCIYDRSQCDHGQVKTNIFNQLHLTSFFFLFTRTGPTGCGKSSLLDILADRKDSRHLAGQVLVDGQPLTNSYKYVVGYVVQDDIISGTLTVRENLMFSAHVRLSASITEQERIDRVEQIIRDLGLESCSNTKIGTEFIRGISGGERKRTCIGMELVLSPKILFLDEPTTGALNEKYRVVLETSVLRF